jgi:hypothetical protein
MMEQSQPFKYMSLNWSELDPRNPFEPPVYTAGRGRPKSENQEREGKFQKSRSKYGAYQSQMGLTGIEILEDEPSTYFEQIRKKRQLIQEDEEKEKEKGEDANPQSVDQSLLHEALKKLNLWLPEIRIASNGSCMFDSLSFVLYGVVELSTYVRHKVSSWLSTRAAFQPPSEAGSDSLFNLENFVVGSWEQYCSDLKKETTWGDHLCLFAAAEIFSVQINIVNKLKITQEDAIFKIDPQAESQSHHRSVYLLHDPEVHYLPLLSNSTSITFSPSPSDYKRSSHRHKATVCVRCGSRFDYRTCSCITFEALVEHFPLKEAGGIANKRQRTGGFTEDDPTSSSSDRIMKMVKQRSEIRNYLNLAMENKDSLLFLSAFDQMSSDATQWREFIPAQWRDSQKNFFSAGPCWFCISQIRRLLVPTQRRKSLSRGAYQTENKRIPSKGEKE